MRWGYFSREKKKPWIYANRDKSKDVQNITLNVYCTVYSICLTRRVNVSILQVWSRIQEVNVYSGFVLEKMADFSLWAPGQSDIGSMSKPKISPCLKFIFISITAPVYSPPPPNIKISIELIPLTALFCSSSFEPIPPPFWICDLGSWASLAFNAIAISQRVFAHTDPPPLAPVQSSAMLFNNPEEFKGSLPLCILGWKKKQKTENAMYSLLWETVLMTVWKDGGSLLWWMWSTLLEMALKH